MTELKDAVARLARPGALPTPPREKLTRTEKLAHELAARWTAGGGSGSDRDESWETVAGRIDFDDLPAARPRDIRRAISEIWEDAGREVAAAPLVAHSLAETRKSYDRELLFAYLRRFPRREHIAFEDLRDAAEVAAERHDWPWRERGRHFDLWHEVRGPKRLAEALLRAEHPAGILRAAGLDGDLAVGRFVRKALDDVCEEVGAEDARAAEPNGTKLAALFNLLSVGGSNAMLAYGLLNPWREASPSEEHRKAVGRVLVRRVGDPRFDLNSWAALHAELRERFPHLDAERLGYTLRRWLVQTTVRAFFTVVARTTDRPDQWAARQAFWLALLDAGAISDAWFALGRQAGSLAHDIADESGIAGHGEIMGAGATDRQSSLIMSIGDVRIAEWSDNGSCRFWSSADPKAPKLYEKSYFGMQLRAMNGGRGFEQRFAALPHTGRWQNHFAAFIHAGSGVRHPRHGEGYSYGGYA